MYSMTEMLLAENGPNDKLQNDLHTCLCYLDHLYSFDQGVRCPLRATMLHRLIGFQ